MECKQRMQAQRIERRERPRPRERAFLVVALTVVGLAYATATSALPLGPTLQLGVGASFPAQPAAVRDLWNTGYGFSAALMFKTVPMLTVGVETGYYRHGSNSQAFEDTVLQPFPGVQLGGFDYWFVPVTAVAELNLLQWGVTKPIVRAGAGYYRTDTTDFTASGFGSNQIDKSVLGDYTNSAFGALLGIGLRTPLVPGTTLSFDATYHFISTDGEPTHFIPVRLRVEF